MLAAIDDGDVDKSADSAGEVVGSAFVPSTGVGLHSPNGSSGRDSPKDADAAEGPGKKPKHINEAERAEQPQLEPALPTQNQGRRRMCVMHVVLVQVCAYCPVAICLCGMA